MRCATDRLLFQPSRGDVPLRSDDPIAAFFRRAGFIVNWDGHRREYPIGWYDLYDARAELVAQVDFGVPLPTLLTACALWSQDFEDTSALDFEIRTPYPPEFFVWITACACAEGLLSPTTTATTATTATTPGV